MKRFNIVFASFLILCIQCQNSTDNSIGIKWSKEKAWEWHKENGWMVGTNFNPSTAINQLEFFQEATFDIETIDRELGWSADLGMNLHRVYLHNLLWNQDSIGFINRLEQYLKISEKYKIKTMFVLLDDVWDPSPKLGIQPKPIPFVHNSGWVQAPGAEILGDSLRHYELKNYIKGVVQHFANDKRVVAWDLYNEPDNVANNEGRAEFEVQDKHIYSYSLIKKVVRWVREVNPSQPVTMGLWKGDHTIWGKSNKLRPLERFMVQNSDVISFHSYDGHKVTAEKIEALKNYQRPILCTEYLARTNGSTFKEILPLFEENQVSAMNWGFVAGKTNTIFPWSSWTKKFDSMPKVWHHDIYRPDKSPFSKQEISFLKSMLLNN